MKRWAIVTVVLYGATLVGLIALVLIAAFQSVEFVGEVFSYWLVWAWIGMMIVGQIALLAVPVRIASGRPVTRLPLVWTLMAAFMMLLVLAVGMFLVALETLTHLEVGSTTNIVVLGAVCGTWLFWAFLFGFYTGGREPKTMMSRLARFLVAGSILELLVAIPAHVYARSKDICCGGFLTVCGLAAGVSVMLFAFGPAVFMLFARRLGSIRPGRSGGAAGSGTSQNE